MYSAAYPGKALWMAENSLLHNDYKLKIKRKEKPNRKGRAVRGFWRFFFCAKAG